MPALKSIFKSVHQTHQKGHESESIVASELTKQGFELLATRWKTPFAEIDLVFEKQNELYILEVKSLGRLDFSPVRVSVSQRARLTRAREWLQNKYNCGVALAFAYVLPDAKILLLDVNGEELT